MHIHVCVLCLYTCSDAYHVHIYMYMSLIAHLHILTRLKLECVYIFYMHILVSTTAASASIVISLWQAEQECDLDKVGGMQFGLCNHDHTCRFHTRQLYCSS